MGLWAKAFVGCVILAGTASAISTLLHPSWPEPARFVLYLVLAVLASGMKLTLSETDGTVSINFVFVLLALAQPGLAEAMVIGCLSVLVQSLYRVRRRFRIVEIAFNVATIANAIVVAGGAYRWLLGRHVPAAPALVLAAAVYFMANTLPIAAVLALKRKRRILPLWYRNFRWYFPYYLAGAAVAAIVVFVSGRFGWFTSLLVFPVAWAMYNSYRLYVDRLVAHKAHLEQMSALHLRTIEALALAIEAKDKNTHNHLCRVRVYALAIGEEMGLSEQEMEALRAASVLHDIGKLAVPEHIINKPGKLTPEEFEKMKIHPVVGAELLERVNFPYPVVPMVRSHHEHWDGSGYPDGLAGAEIPIGARILSAVDCLDALASDRPYRRALTLDETMEELKRLSGTQFDPVVIAILERRCVELEALARLEDSKTAPLHTDIRVARGERPAAGFEQGGVKHADQSAFGDAIAIAERERDALEQVSSNGSSTETLDDLLRVLMRGLRQLVPFDCMAVHAVQGEWLVPLFLAGESASSFSSLPSAVGDGPSAWVAQNCRPIINGNPTVEPNFLGTVGADAALHSALAVPFMDERENVFAVLALYASERDAFTQDDLRMTLALTAKVAPGIEAAMRRGDAVDSDCLTGTLHSLAIEEHIAAAAAAGLPFAVVACDVNEFKCLNQTYGHIEGNRYLRQVAHALRSEVRSTDRIGRTGPDSFAILIAGLTPDDAPDRVAAIESAAHEASATIFGSTLFTIAFGAAFYPEDGRSAESLLRAAEGAMEASRRRRTECASPERPGVSIARVLTAAPVLG